MFLCLSFASIFSDFLFGFRAGYRSSCCFSCQRPLPGMQKVGFRSLRGSETGTGDLHMLYSTPCDLLRIETDFRRPLKQRGYVTFSLYPPPPPTLVDCSLGCYLPIIKNRHDENKTPCNVHLSGRRGVTYTSGDRQGVT